MLIVRPRRNRKSPAIRSLVQETRLHPSDLIQPLFICEGLNKRMPIESLPGIDRLSIDQVIRECERSLEKGVRAIALFPVVPPEKKDRLGAEALNEQGLIPQAIKTIKKTFPSLCLISDIALDPFTSHGHDGLLNETGDDVLNDESVAILTKMALCHAEAGVDWVAPSDMMDGRVGAIRKELDQAGYFNVSIHAYTAKYASSLYAPFEMHYLQLPDEGIKKVIN